uniref:Uncharacterized protein n=1 Tax=Cucumis melo TaxID=3656 RepID=A0A9I9DM72_CUCME
MDEDHHDDVDHDNVDKEDDHEINKNTPTETQEDHVIIYEDQFVQGSHSEEPKETLAPHKD